LSFLWLLLPLQLALANSISEEVPNASHWSCDETSGIRYDSNTIIGNDLTDNNTVGSSVGILGNACDFVSASTEYLSITDGDQSGLESDIFSFGVWLKPGDETTSMPLVSKWSDQYQINLDTGGQLGIDAKNTGGSFLSKYVDGALDDTAFNFYALTFDITTGVVKIWKNATHLTTVTYSSSATGNLKTGTAAFKIGNINTSYFNGEMDEILWDGTQAWSTTTIENLYNAGVPLDYLPAEEGTTTPTTTPETSTETGETLSTHLFRWFIIFFITFFGMIYYFKRKIQV